MKHLNFFVLLLALSISLNGCLSKLPHEESESSTLQNQQASIVHYYPTTTYAYITAVDTSSLLTDLHPDYLILANKISTLGESYVPANLISIDSDYIADWHLDDGLLLEAKAAAALEAMLVEMAASGVLDIKVTSAYRSYAYQLRLYSTYLAREQQGISEDAYRCLGPDYIRVHYTEQGKTALSLADATKVVLSYSAYPGTSEHQTGLCVDFITSEMGTDLTTRFEQTDAFAWLSQNAYRFGFILRYPKTKEAVTGYTYEPWHYRFVGREAATDLQFGGIVLEEYFIST